GGGGGRGARRQAAREEHEGCRERGRGGGCRRRGRGARVAQHRRGDPEGGGDHDQAEQAADGEGRQEGVAKSAVTDRTRATVLLSGRASGTAESRSFAPAALRMTGSVASRRGEGRRVRCCPCRPRLGTGTRTQPAAVLLLGAKFALEVS